MVWPKTEENIGVLDGGCALTLFSDVIRLLHV